MRDYFLKTVQPVLLPVILFTVVITAHAEVVLDGTLGTKGSVTGPNFNIASTMGQTYGGNLFHSFSAFNLNSSESATFTGPSTVTNIISRVTGGQASSIDGTIKSTIAGADFWFINPSGIVFGQNARLDVGGSFHASTADYIKLSDNSRFDASNPATPILTSASPSAFGFLGSNPNSITLKDGAYLNISEGKTLSLVGGNIDIQNSNLYASAGTINLISVASAGEAVVDEHNFNVDSFSRFGDINIKDTRTDTEKPGVGNVDTSGTSGGKIFIRAGKLFVDGGYIFADTYGNINGVGIDIFASELVDLTNDSYISSATYSAGKGGSISIDTARLNVSDSVFIAAGSSGKGDSGNIDINATGSVTISGENSWILGTAYGEGKGGSISIDTARLNVSDSANIAALSSGKGDAGNIDIKATDSIAVSGGSAITSSTSGQGKGGTISVDTGNLILTNGGEISAKSSGTDSGNAGNININAADVIQLIDGSITTAADSAGGGQISLAAGRMINLINSEITATVAGGTSNGGNIDATAPFFILNKSNVIAKADEGKGGNISLKTDVYIRTQNSVVSASSRLGIDGTVVTSSPAIDLSGKVALLQTTYIDTAALAPKQCVEREEELSSFTVKGRDGLPPFPDSLLAIP